MKKNLMKVALALTLCCAVALGALVSAEAVFSEPASDPSPALYVSQKNLYTVVGVITGTRLYDRYTGEPEMDTSAQGSGVVIAEGGYVLTNYHVIEGGSDYQILLSDGTKVDAVVQGSDSEMDLAVLKVEDGEASDRLVPAEIGSYHDLPVGSTVVAIGNPGGEILAHSVTQGIVSALERSSVSSDNTARDVDYIQHDAPISSGNSGGGLFDYKGRLVGINTLKYGGSAYSGSSYEGLGFAIPIDVAYPIAQQLIERGKVVRPQLGVTVSDFNGGDEPADNTPPKSVCVTQVNEGGPAERAGMQAYDFIYSVNGQRVTTTRELKSALDDYNEGDSVTVTVVRYASVQTAQQNNGYGNYGNNRGNYYMDPFSYFFGGYPYGNYGNYYGQNSQGSQSNGGLQVSGGYQFVDLQITLELPEEEK